MRQPIVAQLEKDIIQYWAKVRPDGTGRLPQWAFDFIGVHSHESSQQPLKFRMTSPLCLVDATGKRPEFELETFDDKGAAIKQARTLAREYSQKTGRKIFIVDCQ